MQQEQELTTHPEHPSSSAISSGIFMLLDL